MSKFTYNHDSEDIYEALGITAETAGEIVQKANKIVIKVLSTPISTEKPNVSANSKIVEEYCKGLEKEELAFLLFLVQDQFASLKSQLVQNGILTMAEE
jgi:hypothetical protein